MKLQTLIEILFILLARKKVTANYLANKFGVTTRTIYRYIDELSIPVPIYNERGRNGGFTIADTFKLPAIYFTEDEKSLIINALLQVNGELNSPSLESVIERLTAITNLKQEGSPINFGNLIIDGSAWGSNESYKRTISLIQNGIENKLSLKINYRNRSGNVSEREIHPHTLLLKQGLWYVYAYCTLREEMRLFKIGRINSAKLTTKHFTRQEIGNAHEVFSEWYETLSTIDVDLELTPIVKPDVEEWIGVNNVSENPQGKITASFKSPLNSDLIAKILSFGANVKVIAPKELKQEIISSITEVSKLYN